jgi:hypothetical protein
MGNLNRNDSNYPITRLLNYSIICAVFPHLNSPYALPVAVAAVVVARTTVVVD